jgi:hypothetical protein
MTRKLVSLAVTGVLAAAAGLAPMPAFAQGSPEIEALKAQLAALQTKIEALEKAQTETRRRSRKPRPPPTRRRTPWRRTRRRCHSVATCGIATKPLMSST